MPTIHRLEAENNHSIGGVLVTFDDGTAKQAKWTSSTHVDVKQLAKTLVEQVIQNLLDNKRQDLLDSTNWVSMAAGVAKHIADWNDALVKATGAEIASRVH